jgi:hypothetical protein
MVEELKIFPSGGRRASAIEARRKSRDRVEEAPKLRKGEDGHPTTDDPAVAAGEDMPVAAVVVAALVAVEAVEAALVEVEAVEAEAVEAEGGDPTSVSSKTSLR